MNTEQEHSTTVAEIEGTIRRLRSVVSARVRGNEKGEIEEIHVVTDDSRHPKQVSRDIESLLLSELGLRVDHRKISIAQLREPGLLAGESRLKFLRVDLSMNRADTEIKVSLGAGEDIFSGTSRSERSEAQLEAVAQATAAAVNEYVQCSGEGAVRGSEVRAVLRTVAPRVGEIVTVAIRLAGPQGDENLVGSALIKDSAWQAVAYATLNALNRKMARLLG
ncbi:MAG: hypothetical protein GTO55_06565 [Armatimonadetes bacterium]|nr:hypothetical protein [Armatimonadota bacterium]NIM67792.1 hypothetical protein [Armatimonadota bacterium]NIM76332.1 hypothetical protein [Armatimonadota bacterium]NIN06026.1 hypothetical protein [Armatimonadota bacterium]NIO74473.1 hypothetical protein [Armatimonadota bacterium]